MNIQIFELIEGARKAEGTTVIIDVFRAFSFEAFMVGAGAGTIYAVGREETARRLKSEHPDFILAGERGGKKLPGFDFGNSPVQAEGYNFKEIVDGVEKRKTIIHTTSAGTQGLVNAIHADRILTGSLLNARAIADYIFDQNPEKVSLVAMGYKGLETADEDVLCARYIKSLLEGKPLDMPAELDKLIDCRQSQKYFNPATQEVYPKEDYYICTRYDVYPFVLQVSKVEEDVFRVEPIYL